MKIGNASTKDFNVYTAAGTYSIGDITEYSNAPETSTNMSWGNLLVIRGSNSDTIRQIYYNYSKLAYAERFGSGIGTASPSWGSWFNSQEYAITPITFESGLAPQYQGNYIARFRFPGFYILYVSIGFYSSDNLLHTGVIGSFDRTIMAGNNVLLAGTRYSENNLWEDAAYYITHDGNIQILDGRQARFGSCGGIGII